MGIRAKISIAAAVAFVTAMGLGVQHMFVAVDRLHRGSHEEHVRHLADTIRASAGAFSAAPLEPTAMATMAARLAAYHEVRPLQLVEILGPDQRVVASSRASRVGQRRDLLHGESSGSFMFDEVVEGEHAMTLVQPLFEVRDGAAKSPQLPGTQPLLLAVTSSLVPVEAHIAAVRKTIFITLFATLAFQVVALWVALTVLAVRPVREVISVMHRVEDGDLDLRVSEGRIADEVTLLARSFNSMIEKQRQTQQELDAYLRERMVRADRFATIGELASGLVHEIKNPLAGISGALQVLASDREDAATRARVIGLMQEQVQRVDRVLRDLHAFARPNQPDHTAVAPSDLLERVLLLVRQHHAAASVTVKKELAATQRVRGNNAQLEQAFMNICLNAAQAMERGGSLTVASRDDGDRVVLEITDTGPGIPAELRAKIFKPFFTTKARGTGLGLTIAAQIVEDHAGELSIECPEQGGTRVTIRLPALAEDAPLAQAVASSAAAPRATVGER